MYMPIRHVGEIGPNPIIRKIANTKRHLIWVTFIRDKIKIGLVAYMDASIAIEHFRILVDQVIEIGIRIAW